MRPSVWILISVSACFVVGIFYAPFNEHYVCHWLVHCKECARMPSAFDANDLTAVFFRCLAVLATAPFLLIYKQGRWRIGLAAFACNAAVCWVFASAYRWM